MMLMLMMLLFDCIMNYALHLNYCTVTVSLRYLRCGHIYYCRADFVTVLWFDLCWPGSCLVWKLPMCELCFIQPRTFLDLHSNMCFLLFQSSFTLFFFYRSIELWPIYDLFWPCLGSCTCWTRESYGRQKKDGWYLTSRSPVTTGS